MPATPPVWPRLSGLFLMTILAVSSNAHAFDPPPGETTLDLAFLGGGGLGETATLTLSGPANNSYFIWMSLDEGPTQLPSGWVPSTVEVGVDLVGMSASIPGFYSNLGPGGAITIPLPVPADSYLDGLVLYFQALDLGAAGPPSVGASNQYRLTLQEPSTFVPPLGGEMAKARSGLTATALEDGDVLITGGSRYDIFDPAGQRDSELYTPHLESFEAVGRMVSSRTWHTATRLLDGRVLITGGGTDGYGNATDTAEIYDPDSRSFSSVGSMSVERAFHTATLLADGRVLIAGGSDNVNGTALLTRGLASTEIFDPATNSFSAGPDMSRPRVGHSAVRMGNGDVLLSGGITWEDVFGTRVPSITDSAQVYDASAGSMGNDKQMISEAFGHTAVLLQDGRVAHFAGAGGNVLVPTVLDLVQIYDPSTGSFSNAGQLLSSRTLHTATILDDGRVLIAGGTIGGLLDPQPIADAEIWDVGTGSLPVSDLAAARALQAAVGVGDGTVIILGGASGTDGSTVLASAEIFQP